MNKRSISREWMTARQAADFLSVTLHTVRRACKRGALDGAEMLGQGWVIPRRSLEAARATFRADLDDRTFKGRSRQRRQPLLRGVSATQ